jgi:hypothetical protein
MSSDQKVAHPTSSAAATTPALPVVPRSSFVPYIYSEDELRHLLDAVPAACAVPDSLTEGFAFRALSRGQGASVAGHWLEVVSLRRDGV